MAVGVSRGQIELDLHVGSFGSVGSLDGQMVLVEDVDLALDHFLADVARDAVAPPDHVNDHGNAIANHAWSIHLVGVRACIGTVAGPASGNPAESGSGGRPATHAVITKKIRRRVLAPGFIDHVVDQDLARFRLDDLRSIHGLLPHDRFV